MAEVKGQQVYHPKVGTFGLFKKQQKALETEASEELLRGKVRISSCQTIQCPDRLW